MIKLFKTEISAVCSTIIPELRKGSLKTRKSGVLTVCLLCLMLFAQLTLSMAWADSDSGQEREKPRPVFTRNGDVISAKFIPRAKSTSVIVDFKVNKGGRLVDVKGMDFEKAARPEVDIKNYKSALFVIEIADVSPAGSEATVTVSSDFFASGTEYRVFNEKLPTSWMNSECQNVSTKDRVRDLIVTIKDGGPFDSDGEANGVVTFVGAPRDSFWGYALGTLFIRFFGIFLVLTLLMIGMLCSGAIFSRLESRKTRLASNAVIPEPAMAPAIEEIEEIAAEEEVESDQYPEEFAPVEYETAAAIAIALHLHCSQSDPDNTETDTTPSYSKVTRRGQSSPAAQPSNTWSTQGRDQMMRDRLQTYNRGNR